MCFRSACAQALERGVQHAVSACCARLLLSSRSPIFCGIPPRTRQAVLPRRRNAPPLPDRNGATASVRSRQSACDLLQAWCEALAGVTHACKHRCAILPVGRDRVGIEGARLETQARGVRRSHCTATCWKALARRRVDALFAACAFGVAADDTVGGCRAAANRRPMRPRVRVASEEQGRVSSGACVFARVCAERMRVRTSLRCSSHPP